MSGLAGAVVLALKVQWWLDDDSEEAAAEAAAEAAQLLFEHPGGEANAEVHPVQA